MTERSRPRGSQATSQITPHQFASHQHVRDMTYLAHETVRRAKRAHPDGVAPHQLGGHIPRRGRQTNHPYLNYALRTYRGLLLTFLFNMTMPFTAPLNAFLLLTVYPALVLILLIIELLFWLFMDKLGGKVLVKNWSDKYGGGLTPVNWGSPTIFSSPEAKELVTLTFPTLGAAPPPADAHPATQLRTFDLSIAQTFLLLSSLIYERDDDKVKEAFITYASSPDRERIDFNDKHELPAERLLRRLIGESERKIKHQARAWGIEFAGVSELKSLGGPFCGIFWSTHSNCIIVTFKGTTPTNYDEFLIDATIQRVDSRPFLYGDVHEGFYDALFPASGGTSAGDTRNPFGAILSAIHTTAAHIQRARLELNNGQPTQPVNVWVTGHSLGAAIATALYARFLKSPRDLDPALCVLRSGYLFGTPALGDSDFAAHFASDSNAPYDAQTTLWRVINGSDIICRLPPGVDDPSISMYLARQSIFNFAHVGLAVELNGVPGSVSQPIVVPSAYQPTVEVTIVRGAYGDGEEGEREESGAAAAPEHSKAVDGDDDDDEGEFDLHAADPVTQLPEPKQAWWLKAIEARMGANPIQTLESLYPSFFHNHLPYRYLDSLRRARKFVILDEKGIVAHPNKGDLVKN